MSKAEVGKGNNHSCQQNGGQQEKINISPKYRYGSHQLDMTNSVDRSKITLSPLDLIKQENNFCFMGLSPKEKADQSYRV